MGTRIGRVDNGLTSGLLIVTRLGWGVSRTASWQGLAGFQPFFGLTDPVLEFFQFLVLDHHLESPAGSYLVRKTDPFGRGRDCD